MERKIGETFWFKGKRYKVIASRFNLCISCAFRGACTDSAKVAGICTHRSDKKNVFFKEIKDMEIKDNKLTINIPTGMEIDEKNSDFTNGIIRFKFKSLTYSTIYETLSIDGFTNVLVLKLYRNKLSAISQLMNIAKYYNGDWKPDWKKPDSLKFYIWYDTIREKYDIEFSGGSVRNDVYFKNKKDAQAVIDNPNFREILDAIFKS